MFAIALLTLGLKARFDRPPRVPASDACDRGRRLNALAFPYASTFVRRYADVKELSCLPFDAVIHRDNSWCFSK
jgi:hypothetical protein